MQKKKLSKKGKIAAVGDRAPGSLLGRARGLAWPRLVPAWSTAAGAACPSPRPDYYCRHCTAQQASKPSWSPQRPDLPAHGLLL